MVNGVNVPSFPMDPAKIKPLADRALQTELPKDLHKGLLDGDITRPEMMRVRGHYGVATERANDAQKHAGPREELAAVRGQRAASALFQEVAKHYDGDGAGHGTPASRAKLRASELLDQFGHQLSIGTKALRGDEG